MATIRSAFIDHSLLDDTGDDINGSEVDANPYLLADILDGTTATQLNQSGSMVILNPEVTDISAAAGGIRTALRVRHDPASGTVTAGDGPRILFEADDSAGNKTTIGEIRVPWVTPTDGGTEASNMEFLARVANASVEMLSIGTDGFIFNESGADLDYRFEADNNTSLVSFDAGMFTGVGAVGFGSAAVNTGVVTIDPPAMTAIAATNIARLNIENTAAITVPAGTTSVAATLFLGEPNLTATGTITSAVTLYVEAAPTEGGTNNHAIWSVAGTNRFGGNTTFDALIVSDSTTDATSTTSAAIQTDGGIAAAKGGILGTFLYINDTSNANVTIGLTINQGANDDQIFALKSSDVAHGMTDLAETDTYFHIQKHDAAEGGVALVGYNEGTTAASAALDIYGRHGGTADTTDTASSIGIMNFTSSKKSAATVGNIGATENGFTFSCGGGTRLLVKGNGDVHVTNTTLTALDDVPDALVMRAGRAAMAPEGTWLHDEFVDLIHQYAPILEEKRIMFFERDKEGKITGAMNAIMPSMMLAWDGLYQHHLEIEALKQQLKQLAERN